MDACNTSIPGSYLIAEGQWPIEGKDGSFEMTFDTSARFVKPKRRKDGTVDYREIKEFPTVNEGQVLGYVMPPVPGVPGINVKGEPVPPSPIHEVIPVEGRGTVWTDNGSQVVAIMSGMPQVHQQGTRIRVSILPLLMHAGM